MKNLKLYIAVAVVSAGMALTSCGDSFLDPEPTTQGAAGAAGDPLNINSGLAASYQILGFDSYANGSYESSAFIGDIQSDDAWKGGGDANDGMNGMNLAVSMFNTSGNLTLSGTWNIYTSGITRVNSVLGLIETATTSNPAEVTLIKKYKAEALFLRAYYLYMLWRSFGAVPFQETLFEPPYLCRQLTPDEVYTQIIKDVDGSIENFTDAEMSTNDGTNDGRASLAAAYMLKARTVMYQKDQSKYQEAAKGLAAIIKSGKFTLVSDYAGMWLQEGEFGSESIFEANLVPGSKDWGTAWNSGGTNLPSYISPKVVTQVTLVVGDSVLHVLRLMRCLRRATSVAMLPFAICVAMLLVVKSVKRTQRHGALSTHCVSKILVSGWQNTVLALAITSLRVLAT